MQGDFKLEPLWKFEIATLVALANDAFSDYLVPVQFSRASLVERLRLDNVAWELSRVLVGEVSLYGLLLIARRGWNARLATMGLLPGYRNQGLGSRALEQIIHEARRRGDRQLELEVISGNQAAVHLYTKHGFKKVQDLYSFEREAGAVGPAEPLDSMNPRDVASLIAVDGSPDLPWQLSAETISLYGPPALAHHHDGAYAVTSDPGQPTVKLLSLIVPTHKRRQGRAKALLTSLINLYGEQRLQIPALCPAEFKPLFTSSGFERGSISQLHMRLDL